MSDTSDPCNESDTVDDAEGEPLSSWGRFAAGITGLALSGSGAAAVFVTDNQAGSVALVLGGIVFLLMLISGNPLLSLGHGDTQMKFAAKRRRERVINEAREAPPQEARRTLDVLRTVDPGATSDTSFIQTSAHVYGSLLKVELIRIYPEYDLIEQRVDAGADFRIHTPDRRSASIEVKYLGQQRALSAMHVRQLIGMASVSAEGHLLISNRRLTRAAAEMMSDAQGRGIKVEFVHWRDDLDNRDLKQAVDTLLRGDASSQL
ncbi:hypothetical protein OHB56_12100 [Streptomyces sp. NBC_01635]|uniref:hypothetical protein n=1 Tax=Streptomyces sp. NBC_01635 TaxID=2975904 RepID=UPI003868B074|nr:hypothetical protein OHB56_12100 [Streptomyces sp. NBC_01635]